MKILKAAAATLVLLAAVLLLGRFFLAQVATGSARQEGPSAIVFAAPAGFEIENRGELPPAAAARELSRLAAARPAPRLGLHFTTGGTEIYWLLDRADPAAPTLRELSASPAGTRLERIWRGGLEARLKHAAANGSFDAPGLPPVEEKNLYH